MEKSNAHKLLENCLAVMENVSMESGVCCCGDEMEKHSNVFDSGHMPVDSGVYAAGSLIKEIKKELGIKDGIGN